MYHFVMMISGWFPIFDNDAQFQKSIEPNLEY